MESMKWNILDISSRGRKEGQSKKENAKGQQEQKVSLRLPALKTEKKKAFF